MLARPPLNAAACLLAVIVAARAPAADNAAPAQAPALSKAQAAFEKLKSLAGYWEGKSTKGWTERVGYRVISGGSVLMELSFGAHPNEWMATMFHMDGDRLMLTHYCVAKNQPRLVATRFADDLSSMTFEFLDGTNLKSRDKGHMDKVVIRIDGPDHFFSRWTWYQDGKESWMEDIEHRRIKDAPADSLLGANSSPSAKTGVTGSTLCVDASAVRAPQSQPAQSSQAPAPSR